ncbi:glutamate ABC transporter substrate-binding protein [Streptomyces hebeiensis]|uniref:Glutamate ABC transporter substrate-binding protein n=2 Tax=Streptomyces hebeiensis TaxID=229486 RepID=A0ABN1UWA3_9ACTN
MGTVGGLDRSHGRDSAGGPSPVPARGPGPAGRLRGWGGVSAMAAACALTAAVTLLPLSHSVDSRAERVTSGQRTASVTRADDDACETPEASLRPSPDGADGDTVRSIRERPNRKLVVGVDQNSYRWGYRDPVTGDLEGFDIDLARAIAEDILGSRDDVIFRAIPTNQREAALNNGTVDLVVRTMTITCDRRQRVDFSTAYFQVGQQVLAPKGSSITGFDASLAGKRVCTAEDSTAYQALEKDAHGAIFKDEHDGTPADEDRLTVPNQLDCLVRLQLGEVDAVVTDNALAAGQAAQDPAVELVGEPLPPEYYGVAVKLGNDDLVRRVNKVLEGYRAGGADSRWMRSYETWLKAGLPGITAPPPARYRNE